MRRLKRTAGRSSIWLTKAQQHPTIILLFIFGAIASIVGLIPFIVQPRDLAGSLLSVIGFSTPPRPSIEKIEISNRSALWGHEEFDEDEIVVRIVGKPTPYHRKLKSKSIVVFWRLANDYETNWHIACRRVGGDYEIATTPAMLTTGGKWGFLAGGIECNKSYEGDIGILMAFIPGSELDEKREEWLSKSSSWGFEEIPVKVDNALVSNIEVVSTKPFR